MTTYHEHHKIPKSYFRKPEWLSIEYGMNAPRNLENLTLKEHIEAHKKLWEKYGYWEDELAWKGMAGIIGKEEVVRLAMSKANKGRKLPEGSRLGKKNPFYGKSHTEENKRFWKNKFGKPYKFLSPLGELIEGISLNSLCKQHNLSQAAMWCLLHNKNGKKTHKGWTRTK